MGSSVWHGGFSTLIAIIVLAPSKSYIFVVFFRLWLGIICFGLANGFCLLPVILSFFGPTYSVDDPAADDDAPETDAEDPGKEAEMSMIESVADQIGANSTQLDIDRTTNELLDPSMISAI